MKDRKQRRGNGLMQWGYVDMWCLFIHYSSSPVSLSFLNVINLIFFAILALMSGNMQSHILQGFVAHTTQDLR